MGTGCVRIGTSGWRYAPWRGAFYPPALAQRCELHYASRIFNSIEINGSFYSLQRPEVYARWYADTPTGFQFAVKGPRFITHVKRLRDSARPLGNFFASGVCELREKLGPLWQLPPSLRFHPEVIEEFLNRLPFDTEAALRLARTPGVRLRGKGGSRVATEQRRRLRHALEVRHESFRDPHFIAMLRRHHVALVVSDSPKTWLRLEDVTADFLYRLHGATRLYRSGYSPAALARWGKRIKSWRAGGIPAGSQLASGRSPPHRSSRDVYCYFDNTDAKVRAPANARQLAQLLAQRR